MLIFHKNFLASELAKWRDSGLIDSQTAQKIADRYAIDMTNASEGKNFILKIVAYLFLALSLITLIGANWEEIPRIVRLTLVLSVLGCVNLSGFFAAKNGKDSQATALFFLGNFCYGAAIILVAQIYHIGEHMPDGVLLWAVGALALGLAVQKSIIMTQALILALIWFIMELYFGDIMHGILIFIAASLAVLWRDSSKMLTNTLFITVFIYFVAFLLRQWMHISIFYDNVDFHASIYGAHLFSFAYCLLGVCLSYLAEKAGKFKIAFDLKIVSIVTAVGLLILDMMFYNEFESVRYIFSGESLHTLDAFMFYVTDFGFLYMLFCALSLGITIYFKKFTISALSVFTLIFPYVLYISGIYGEALFSTISVIIAIILIKYDYKFIGVGLIFLVAMTRYIDLIGDYIGASLLFLIFSIIVLAVARKRRAK